MPVVPVYNQRVAPGGANTPYESAPSATPAAFGALTGQALENLGKGVDDLGKGVTAYLAEVNKDNIERDTQTAYISAAQRRSLLLNGDGTDANPGLMNLQGENAMKAWPTVQASLQQIKDDTLKGVTNAHVRDAFTKAWDATTEVKVENGLNHVYQQREVANKVASKAIVTAAEDDAATNYNSTRAIDQASIMIGEQVAKQATNDGVDNATMQQLVNQAHSKLFERVIKSAAVLGSTQKGEELFVQYEAGMDGVTKANVVDFLDRKKKQDLSDRIAHENYSHTVTTRYQEANFNTLGGKVFDGTITDQELGLAEQHGLVNFEQMKTLEAYRKHKIEDGGDSDEANSVTVQVMMGESSSKDIMDNPKLDAKQKNTLLTKLKEVETQGPIFGRYDVKKAATAVGDSAGGQRDFFGKYTEAIDRANERDSVEAFYTQIRNVDQTKTPLTPELVAEIRDKTITAYANKNLPASSAVTHLPITPYLPRIIGVRTQAQWLEAAKAGKDKLNSDHENHLISDEEFNRQSDLLLQYKSTIDRIVENK